MSVALYVPGSRPDRFDKAAATGADVILDLEDSVATGDKDAARLAVADWVASYDGAVQVRVNAPGSAELAADLVALPPAVELRVPKVGAPADLDSLAGRRVHALLESAAAVEHAFVIASCPEVVTIALGEADLSAELGLDGEDAFDWVRSRVVVAAAAAGLPAPMMAAFPGVRDLAGLEASCLRGRRLGLWGRSAIHPAQLPVIRSVFTPTDAEVAWAREVLTALAVTGVGTLTDGSMVDAAMARRARTILRGQASQTG